MPKPHLWQFLSWIINNMEAGRGIKRWEILLIWPQKGFQQITLKRSMGLCSYLGQQFREEYT